MYRPLRNATQAGRKYDDAYRPVPRTPLIRSGHRNPTVNQMLSQDLDRLATLVPQYLYHGEFKLTGGGTVTWYIDGHQLLLNDTGINIAGRILNQLLLPGNRSSRQSCHGRHHHRERRPAGRNPLGCYVRDDSKGHGLQKQISGNTVSGRKVAIVHAAADTRCSSAPRTSSSTPEKQSKSSLSLTETPAGRRRRSRLPL